MNDLSKEAPQSKLVSITPDEPALFVTTQTTIPLLTTLMFGFSLALMAVGTTKEWASVPLLLSINSKAAAVSLLGLSAFLFLFATEACVKSHAWDYYALPQDHRQQQNLSAEESYILRCFRRSQLWHKWGTRGYNLGFMSVLLGAAVLFFPISLAVTLLAFSYLVISIAVKVLKCRWPDVVNRVADWFEKRGGIEHVA